MAQAVDAFSAGQAGPAQPYVGAFLCSAPRLVELRSVLHPDAQLDLGLVVPGGVEALPAALQTVAADPRLRLKAVELPAGDAGVPLTLDALDDMLEQGVPAYVEVPLDSYVPDAAAVVRAAGRRLKMRTGGTTAAAFPTSAQLAAGLITCAAEQLAFKLTAGLHHAVRYRDSATGFEHHGFLNVLAAVANAPTADRPPTSRTCWRSATSPRSHSGPPHWTTARPLASERCSSASAPAAPATPWTTWSPSACCPR